MGVGRTIWIKEVDCMVMEIKLLVVSGLKFGQKFKYNVVHIKYM